LTNAMVLDKEVAELIFGRPLKEILRKEDYL
jgi:hypothetical protein